MDINISESKRAQKARELFQKGCKCAQAVLISFEDLHHMDSEMALKLSSSFSAGMGELGQTCGAVTGMFMVAGLLYGFSYPSSENEINEHLERIKKLGKEFEAATGSILCVKYPLPSNCKDNEPCLETKKNTNCCQKIECDELVGIATVIMENYISKNPPILS